ncbi:hypothetical protein JFL47_01970 [Haemophilus haemoglobinophilus]|nr:hypothetical protein [Canicola haemoglobinophilus]
MKKIKNVLMILPLLFLSTHSNAFETNTDISQLEKLEFSEKYAIGLFQKDGKVYFKYKNKLLCELKKPIKNKKVEKENEKLFSTLKQEFDFLKKVVFINASDINEKSEKFLDSYNKLIENAYCKAVYSKKELKEQKEMFNYFINKAIKFNKIFIENLENKNNEHFFESKMFDETYQISKYIQAQKIDFLLKKLEE